jgi:hypothetical protein
MDQWLFEHNFMMIPISEDGTCSVSVVWTAIQLHLLPNHQAVLNTFRELQDFIQACATRRWNIEADEDIQLHEPNLPSTKQMLADIMENGEPALQKWWHQLDGSLLDAALGIAECGARVYCMQYLEKTKSIKTSQITYEGKPNSATLDILRQDMPRPHFSLLVTNEQHQKLCPKPMEEVSN